MCSRKLLLLIFVTLVAACPVFLLGNGVEPPAFSKDDCRVGSGQYGEIRPTGVYKEYSFSSDPLSFTRVEPDRIKPKILGICDGFVKVYAYSAQTVLYMPFGWETEETGKLTSFWTPDERARILLHFAHQPQLAHVSAGQSEFSLNQKKATIDDARHLMTKIGAKEFREISMSEADVAYKALNVPTQSGARNSFMQVLTFNEVKPAFPMSISLLARADRFEKYAQLLGLILRDREIKWTTGEESLEQFFTMGKEVFGSQGLLGSLEEGSSGPQDSNQFFQFAKDAIQLLAKGSEEGFMRLMSGTVLDSQRLEESRQYVRNVLIPFFSDYVREGNSITIAPAHDASGNRGYAFYMSAKTRTDDERPFVLYVVKEQERFAVANVVVNKTYQDLHK